MASTHFLCSNHLYSPCVGNSRINSFRNGGLSLSSSYRSNGFSCFNRKAQLHRTHFVKAMISDSKTGRNQVELVYDPDERLNKLADEVDKNAGLSRLTLFSPCKINVFLRITNKREDGFHDLASLFHVISLGDKIKFSLSPSKSKDRLSTNVSGVPLDDSNLIIKALNLYRKKTSSDNFFWVHLDKKVPTGAGLGGGSSNAATAMWAANQFNGCLASEKELQEWSGYCTGRGEAAVAWIAKVGGLSSGEGLVADGALVGPTPSVGGRGSHGGGGVLIAAGLFVLGIDRRFGDFQWNEGRFAVGWCCSGRSVKEVVLDIPPPIPLDIPMVLIKPPQACSTAEVYKRLRLDRTSDVDPLTLLEKISRTGISQDVCVNDLEPPAFEVLPSLKRLKQRVIAAGRGQYDAVFMSGSGSTIVGVGSPDPPQFVYDDEEYQEVFLSEARFITRTENQWYSEPFSTDACSSSADLSSSYE
ncbi:hypothetical protein RJ639_013774 [Escallonia herrerae]|uniref:4-(cytidine 5'-diphospho)-2-C-methyl-D-erythritol kinase n=1 Tax=Escallonia herrerae TaxID=1293975 RepID=A0AA88VGZ2_9ASTE|nr:hypothetical protein RJ639_013774 [Escallonia herrerae]